MTPAIADVQEALVLLGYAEDECLARGSLATHPLDDAAVWSHYAVEVWWAIECVRCTVDPPLPPAPRRPDSQRRTPLELLTEAADVVLRFPDDLGNPMSWHALIATTDALHRFRVHDG